MGIADAEFWRITPRQLGLLAKRFEGRQKREDLLVGLLASVTANYSFCAPKEPLCPADFMPKQKSEMDEEGFEPETDEDLALVTSALLSTISVVAGH